MNSAMIPLAALPGALWPLFLDSALKGTVLLALAGLAVIALRKASAATRHLVWLFAIAALLVTPLVSVLLPGWRVLPRWTPATASTVRFTATPARMATSAPPPLTSIADPIDRAFAPTVAPAVATHPEPMTVCDWLLLTWVAGFAFFVMRLFAAHCLLRRAARECVTVVEGGLASAMNEAGRRLGVHRPVRLLLDAHRTIPMAWGVFRPQLLVPAGAAEWGESRLASVFLHEMAHVKRGDMAVQWLTQLAYALHWFNPFVWLAARRLHVERERACDDLVLATGVRASEYAEHLLTVATTLAPAPWGHICGVAMARPSRLEGRLLAVLNQRLNRRPLTRALALIVLGLGLCVMIPVAILRAADDQKPETNGRTAPEDQPENAVFPRPARPDGKVAVVRGRLTDATGKPIPRRIIWIVGTRKGERVTYQDGPTGAEGHFNFGGVPVGVAWEVFIPKDNGPEGFASQSITLPDTRDREIEVHFDGATVATKLTSAGGDVQPDAAIKNAKSGAAIQPDGKQNAVARQIELLNKEMELAAQQLKEAREQNKNGTALSGAVFEQQKELALLKRELAKLQNDFPAFEKAIKEQIDLVKQLREAQQQRVEVGIDTRGSLLGLEREILRLERELAAAKGTASGERAGPQPTPKKDSETERTGQMQNLQEQLESLREKYKDSHPAVRTVRDRMEKLRVGANIPPRAESRREVIIYAPKPGFVTGVLVEEGVKVKRGERLIQLDDREERARSERARAQLDAAKAELKVQEITAKSAMADYDRAKELADAKLLSQGELASKAQASELAHANIAKAAAGVALTEQDVRQAALELEMRGVVAPKDGTVLGVKVLEGEHAFLAQPLVVLGD